MGGYERKNHASSTVLKPSSRAPSVSSTDAPSPARVTLPSDLSGSLKYLDDAQLQRLLEAVTVEINRRNQGAPRNETAMAAATGTSSQGQSAAFRDKKIRGIDEIPEGKANLIRALGLRGHAAWPPAPEFPIEQEGQPRTPSRSVVHHGADQSNDGCRTGSDAMAARRRSAASGDRPNRPASALASCGRLIRIRRASASCEIPAARRLSRDKFHTSLGSRPPR